MAHDVFISYAQEDKAIADAACATLEREGIRCWIAPRDVLSGLDWPAQIVEAIESTKILVLVFSDHANNSWPVKNEVERAMNREVPIIPLRIQNVPPSKSLEFFISTPHWLDALSPPIEAHLKKLVPTVRALLERREADPAKRQERRREIPPPEPIRRGMPISVIVSGAVAMIAVVVALWALLGRGEKDKLSTTAQPPAQAAEVIQGTAPSPAAIAPAINPAPVPDAPSANPTPAAPTVPEGQQSLRDRVMGLIQAGMFNDAISVAENARQANPIDQREAILLKGMSKVHYLDHRGAVQDLEPLVRGRDVPTEIRVWLGIAYIARDELQRAQGQIAFVLRQTPKDPLALAARSMLEAAQWDGDDSIKTAIEATQLAPQNVMTWIALGNAHNAKGNVSAASEAFGKAIALSPKSPGALAGRASARAIAGQLAAAEDDARLAVSLASPNTSIPHLALFQVFMARDEYALALSAAEEAVNRDKQFWPPLIARASAAIVNNRGDEALRDANEAVRLASNRPETFAIRAWAQAKVGNIQNATTDGNTAVQRGRNSPAVYNGRGLARLFSNNAAGAVEDFEKLRELLPNSPYSQLMRATAQVQAYAQAAPTRLSQAESDSKQLIENGAYIKQSYRLLAQIYAATNRPQLAAEAIQRSQ
jgi:tetratricopeptide (TPR) repeat protein